jgi:hypothetical protein
MTLASVRTGKRSAPDRLLVVGVEGIGKTTFGASAPAPIFIAAEDGINQVDVASFPEPQSFQDVLDAVDTLITEQHEYRTLVIDTVDWLEALVWRDVCLANKWEMIETPGYGRGYTVALDEWRRLISRLSSLRERRGMEVILLAHAAIRMFANPSGADYSRYECKLHKGAAALLREWCDTNLFAVHEEFTRKDGSRVKGISTGRRVLKTERTAAWDAKNRYGLPPELPLSYQDYAEARDAGSATGSTANAAELLEEARRLLAELDPPTEKREAIAAHIEKHSTNAAGLAATINRLRNLIAETKGE